MDLIIRHKLADKTAYNKKRFYLKKKKKKNISKQLNDLFIDKSADIDDNFSFSLFYQANNIFVLLDCIV